MISFFGLQHSNNWYALVRNKKTGKERTYFFGCNMATRETVAAHIAKHFHNVEVLTIYPKDTRPAPDKQLAPIPPEDFEYGYRDAVERYLRGEPDPDEKPAMQPRGGASRKLFIPPKPALLHPISLKPLSPL